MVRGISSASLVARTEELDELNDALSAAVEGTRQIVLLGGEAGIGKTRLIQALGERARASGIREIFGGCVKVGRGRLPYAPFVEALRHLTRTEGNALLSEILGSRHRELVRLVPFAAEPFPVTHENGMDGTETVLFECLLELLVKLQQDSPIILSVEDIHWADQSTLDVLHFLTRNLIQERILLIVTYRSDDLPPEVKAAIAELLRVRGVSQMNLTPLDRDETAALIESILNRQASSPLSERIFELSGGNPFFVEQLLAAESEGDFPLPTTVADTVLTRVAELPGDAQQTLHIAAIAGGRIRNTLLQEVWGHNALRAASGSDQTAFARSIRDCIRSGILMKAPEPNTYEFRHALSREAISQDILPNESAAVHKALAEALSAEPQLSLTGGVTAAVELSHHWRAAGDAPEALAAAVAAGRLASHVHAYDEADRQFERAIELWDSVQNASEIAEMEEELLLQQAAETARWAGRTKRAVQLTGLALERIDSAKQPNEAAALLERLGRYLWEAGDSAACARAENEAAALLEGLPPSPLQARVLAAQGATLMVAGRYSESLNKCKRAIAIANAVGALAETGHALNALGVDLAMLGDSEAGSDALRRALDIAEDSGTLEDLCRTYGNLSHLLHQTGQLAEALKVERQGLEASRRFGRPLAARALLLANTVSTMVDSGEWIEAEALISAAESEPLPGWTEQYLLIHRADLSTARARLDPARVCLGRARKLSRARTEPLALGPLEMAEAELAIWERNTPVARVAVDAGLEVALDSEDDQLGLRLCALGLRAEADLVERSRLLRSTELRESLERVEILGDKARALASTLSSNGRLFPEAKAAALSCNAEFTRAFREDAIENWRLAAEAWESAERPYAAAYSRYRLAESLLHGKQRQAAARELGLSAETTIRLNAVLLREEILAVARRARIEPLDQVMGSPTRERDKSPASRLRLTSREQEVLALVMEGRTNRQIGTALYITEKTASVHVSNILTKLGVANRGEAAAAARRLGIAKEEQLSNRA